MAGLPVGDGAGSTKTLRECGGCRAPLRASSLTHTVLAFCGVAMLAYVTPGLVRDHVRRCGVTANRVDRRRSAVRTAGAHERRRDRYRRHPRRGGCGDVSSPRTCSISRPPCSSWRCSPSSATPAGRSRCRSTGWDCSTWPWAPPRGRSSFCFEALDDALDLETLRGESERAERKA